MAEGLEMGKDPNDPTHSRTLFLREDGSSISFYVRPGPAKRRLSTLILHGGGTVCRVQEPEAVLLAQPGEAQAEASGDFISTQYITDCVERNERLALEDYRLGRPSESPERACSQPGEDYTEAEDAAVVRYVKENARSPGALAGTALWKGLEKAGLTRHPWQSMKERYLRHLKPLEAEDAASPVLKLKRQAEEAPTASREPEKKKAPYLPEEDTAKEQVQESETTKEDVLCFDKEEMEESEVHDQTPDLELAVIKNAELTSPGKNDSNLKEAPKDNEIVEDAVVLETQLTSGESCSSASFSPEVGAAIKVIKHLMEEFRVDLATVTQAFLKNSGELEAACFFLQTGKRSDGYPIWTRQDDVDLWKDDESTKSKLIKKFGAKNVERRVEFRRN